MYLGSQKIDDYLTFTCNTHTPSTGEVTDADALPTYKIYENETGTAIDTGDTAKLDDAGTIGFYSEQIQLLAATGYEIGKTYTIRVSAIVGGVTGTTSHTFTIKDTAPACVEVVDMQQGVYDQINAECDLALTDYAGPTRVESTTDKNEIITEVTTLHSTTDEKIDGLEDLTVADIKAGIVDGSYDLEEMMRLIFATLCGKVSGGGSSTITTRDGPDTKNRVITTVDVNGNRTAQTLDGT